MDGREAIEQWDLDQLSTFLGDVELRYEEQLLAQERDGSYVAELMNKRLSSGPKDEMEDALRELAFLAFDRDQRHG